MKKISILLLFCLIAGFSTMAQKSEDDAAFVNKRGIALLPKAGDFALGVDATPFFKYLGNIFNNSTDNSLSFNGVDNTIYGKYFLQDNRAIRAKLRMNFYGDQFKQSVTDDAEIVGDPLNDLATVIDVHKVKTTDMDLFVGYEFRRGRGRVQGFWGGEVGLGFNSAKSIYDYANPMTAMNTFPSTGNFGSNIDGARRVTEAKSGPSFRCSLGGFVGVEYFFAPQISVGGEFNIRFECQTKGQTEVTAQEWNISKSNIQNIKYRQRDKLDLAKSTGLGTKTEGHLFLMFHF